MAQASLRSRVSQTAPWLSRRWHVAGLGVLLTLSTALRLHQLDTRGLWVDEVFTALYASADKGVFAVAHGPLSSPRQ